LALAAVVLERLEQAALGVAGPQRQLLVAVHVDAAAEGQVRLTRAVDVRDDREVAAAEGIAQGALDLVRHLHFGQWCWWLRRSHSGSPTVSRLSNGGDYKA